MRIDTSQPGAWTAMRGPGLDAKTRHAPDHFNAARRCGRRGELARAFSNPIEPNMRPENALALCFFEHLYPTGAPVWSDDALADIETVSVTAAQADLAIEAFRRFGRAWHPASLNLGDCFAYALAKATGQSLLFKGADFSQTGISPALLAAP